jgi:hypothetical protein
MCYALPPIDREAVIGRPTRFTHPDGRPIGDLGSSWKDDDYR